MNYVNGLKPGDLIVVAYKNTLYHGIFIENSKSGRPFYLPLPTYQGRSQEDYKDQYWIKKYEGEGRLIKTLINRLNDPIAKLDESCLSDEAKKIYRYNVNYLKTKGLIT